MAGYFTPHLFVVAEEKSMPDASVESGRTPPDEPNRAPPEHILQFFAYAHLRGDLQATSKLWHDLAVQIVNTIPRNPERTVALRKLLESKDAAVRAVIAQ